MKITFLTKTDLRWVY